jgi:hypothetical protein
MASDAQRLEYLREYRADPTYKQQRAIWFEKNHDYYKNWLELNPGYHRIWQETNRCHYRNYQKKWRSKHREDINSYMRAYMRSYRQHKNGS